uniref:hypothetical protein n=1 Tax=Flavobacterium sp. TaxID=239 RepID=UPI004049CFED
MYQTIQSLHSIWAYLSLAVLLIAVLNALSGYFSKRTFEVKDLRISLFALIFSHIQLVLGLVTYFVSPLGLDAFSTEGAMKNPELRLTMLEHPLINIIAIALITVGWSLHKKVEGTVKFRRIMVFYTLGLLLILSRIPWKMWF